MFSLSLLGVEMTDISKVLADRAAVLPEIVADAQRMLDEGLDWMDNTLLYADCCLVSFSDGIWIVDMANAGCNPDAGIKLALVLELFCGA